MVEWVLTPGIRLVFYTDGDVRVNRLDAALAACPPHAGDALEGILDGFAQFAGVGPPGDDSDSFARRFPLSWSRRADCGRCPCAPTPWV